MCRPSQALLALLWAMGLGACASGASQPPIAQGADARAGERAGHGEQRAGLADAGAAAATAAHPEGTLAIAPAPATALAAAGTASASATTGTAAGPVAPATETGPAASPPCAALAGAATKAPVPALAPLGLRLVVVEEEGRPVVDQAWVDRELAEANRLLEPHGVTVAASEHAALPAPYATLENAVDRDALARERKPGVVNVFIVRSLRDVDEPSRFILGVRWRLLRDTSKDYVILSSIASPTTLAHELGHLLGLDHSGVVDNVMSYRRADPARLAFDAAQGAKMRRTARSRIARGEIVPLAPVGASSPSPCPASP